MKNKTIIHSASKSYKKNVHRKLEVLKGKGNVIFADDYKMTEEEFLGF